MSVLIILGVAAVVLVGVTLRVNDRQARKGGEAFAADISPAHRILRLLGHKRVSPVVADGLTRAGLGILAAMSLIKAIEDTAFQPAWAQPAGCGGGWDALCWEYETCAGWLWWEVCTTSLYYQEAENDSSGGGGANPDEESESDECLESMLGEPGPWNCPDEA